MVHLTGTKEWYPIIFVLTNENIGNAINIGNSYLFMLNSNRVSE